jgi:hypothetical protein
MLEAHLLLKNKVFNCIFFGMILGVSVLLLSHHQKIELSRGFGMTLFAYIT